MAFNPDITAFDLTARSVKVKVLAVDDLFTSYGLALGVKVIPNTTRNLDKAIGYGFTTIGIKVIFPSIIIFKEDPFTVISWVV